MRRVLSMTAAVLAMALTVSAQETRVILVTVPQQQRQGVYVTPSTTFPDTVSEVQLVLDIAPADYVDPANSVRMSLYFLDAATQTWRMFTSARWRGGAYTDPETGEVNPRPVISPGLNAVRGRPVRGEIEIPVRMRIGCTIETVTIP